MALRRRRRKELPPLVEARRDTMLAAVKSDARDKPGTYRLLAEDGEVLYVGKSKGVRTRLLTHFRAEYPRDKSARMIAEAHSVAWDYEPSEFAACISELRLIKRWRPRYNVAMKRDARHYAFIRLTAGPAPKLHVVRGSHGHDDATYFGPFHGAVQLAEALRELNDALGLRDCALDTRMHFADQVELPVAVARTPGCIRYEIGRCLGPCVAATTAAQYDERVRLAREFLAGRHDAPIVALREAMEASSERLEFERAAALRDKVTRLESLQAQFTRLRFAVETLSFTYTVSGDGGDDRAYVIRRGRVRHEGPAPRTPAEQALFDARVAEVFAPVARDSGAVPAHEIDELLLVASWFRQHPAELERATPTAPALTRSA
ncbi:MAG: UvrB/UvrC motif-containing protein [Gemmatimonadetes bacterium]|nr:UvrB/UvrC motif-containing protein [Gemmatimonadota bacterium]